MSFHQFASTDRHQICLFLDISQTSRLINVVFENLVELLKLGWVLRLPHKSA